MKRLAGVAALLVLVTLAWVGITSAQTTTVTFDNPAPPGSSFSLLSGVFQGIDFGTGQWRWESAYGVDPTNHVFFDSGTGTSRTLRFSPAPRTLTSLRVFTTAAGTLTLSDDRGQTLTRAVNPGSLQLVTTGWVQSSTTITVAFSAGWNLGIDDITYTGAGGADTTPPTVSLTAPADGAVVTGTVNMTAQAADNIGVAGVQFLVNGAPLGPEDTQAPYATSWNTTTVGNGAYTVTAVARDVAGNQTISTAARVTVSNGSTGGGAGYALRFHGNGVNDIDRVKILIDDPSTTAPGPPADVGATDFTLEFWVRALPAENSAPPVACGANNNWISGNIVVDRDRYNQGRAFGVSIAGGVVAYGVLGTGTGALTICGTTNVLDNQWHHVAVQRRRADGWLWLYVDGRLEAQGDGPDGDVSYPDDGVPGDFCGGPCTNSDPYLVLGAEKHDAGAQFPSFAGWLDELRLSNVLRYGPNFTRPALPFVPDATTVALYHFDEGSGDVIVDTPGFLGGPSHGVRRFGGSPAGPEWVPSDAPLGRGPAQIGQWSGVINFPIVAVNMMMLRTGQVLMWDGYAFGGDARLWHPTLGTFTAVPVSFTNLFCSAQVMLADGTALVVGGHQADFVGLRDTSRFDPTTQSWGQAAPMAFPRWYPTATTLPDGRVLVVSGSTTCEACIADTPEVYDPIANAWDQLTGASLSMPLYPFMFVLPDGRVLYAGSDEANTVTRVLDLGSETWTTVDPVVVAGGSAAMYRPGVVLKAGAPANTFRPEQPAVNTAYVLDMTQPSPAWRQVGSMASPRAYHTLTVLPDGTTIVTGGIRTTGVTTGQAVHPAEIWDPASETWSTMASMQVRRSYHSTGLLLPDGRVLVAGSGRSADVNQLNAEIFSPPYLFRGARPVITSAPATVSAGAIFFVGTPDGDDIESVALVRLGAVTHGVDMDQRFVPLSFAPASDGVTIQAPATTNVAPPGYYMLFLVNTAGVPSIAAFVQISRPDGAAPTVTITTPTSGATYGTGSSPLGLSGTAADDIGVTQVTWANDRGGSGTATGTTSWSVSGVVLQPGPNVVTITARDADGKIGTDTLTVTYTPPGDNPVPTTTGLSPVSAAAGGPALTLTVNGTNFVNGSVVRWNGADRATTFVSATQLTAAIGAGDIVTAGTAQVTVFNPSPGGGSSNAQPFTISASAPITVTFDNPIPSGSSGSFLNGLFQGLNFGTSQWRWENAYGADPTRHIYFASSSGTSRTFTFSPGPRVLVSLRVFTGAGGTLTLTDNLGQNRTQAITTGSMQLVTTGWTQGSTTITVSFTAGWELGVDDIAHRSP